MQKAAQTYIDRIPLSHPFTQHIKDKTNAQVNRHFYYNLLKTLSSCLQYPAITALNTQLQNWNTRNDKLDILNTILANFNRDERAQLWLNKRFLFISNSNLETKSVDRYSGTWLADLKHGNGRLELCDDGCTFYEGGFGMDRFNGHGVFWKGCAKWAGSWLDDEFRGAEGELLPEGQCKVERGECAAKKVCECTKKKVCERKWKKSEEFCIRIKVAKHLKKNVLNLYGNLPKFKRDIPELFIFGCQNAATA
jgi:hypothetical protein